jgi:hypothetical protein
MLDPRGRQVLLESLRPPEGYRFDCAVGTTFSLDLIALLTAPLGFAMFDWQDDDGRLAADPASGKGDPLALLESLRRCADRIHIYCQAGQIKVPPANQRLLAYLEQSVIEVIPPSAREGRASVFHPKVWALRFVDSTDGSKVRYRLLCLTRNLTFDRSWDTVLVLEGDRSDRQKGIAENRALAGFVSGLPGLAVRASALDPQAVSDTALIADELRVVKWSLPDGVDSIRFWPLGMDGKAAWPFGERIDRLLIVSPFVTPDFLKRISAPGRAQSLVSRPESLREIESEVLRQHWSCHTLDEGCEAIAGPDDATEQAGASLSGLHAKIFVADVGWNAHVWTGSANATAAAFGGNVEFLVELVGKKSKLGVAATIGEDDNQPNLRSMLAPFTPEDQAVTRSADDKACEELVDSIRRSLVTMDMDLFVEPNAMDSTAVTTTLRSSEPLFLSAGATLRCRPAMLVGEARALPSGQVIKACFGPHAIQSVSSFISFEVSAKVGEAERTEAFVLNLPLVGAPADRKERLLRDLLSDSRTLIRFLLMLLSDDPERLFNELRELAADSGANGAAHSHDGLPLLEHMLASLHRSPGKLDQVQRLIDDLRKTPEGRSILPAELEAVWGPIGQVRREFGNRAAGGEQ